MSQLEVIRRYKFESIFEYESYPLKYYRYLSPDTPPPSSSWCHPTGGWQLLFWNGRCELYNLSPLNGAKGNKINVIVAPANCNCHIWSLQWVFQNRTDLHINTNALQACPLHIAPSLRWCCKPLAGYTSCHRLQPSQILRDSHRFLALVPGPGRP